MKRKLQLEESEDKKTGKTMRLSETFIELNNINDMKTVNEERNLNFKLTDKKAKSNLLKGANRLHLEIEDKQKSKNMRFSAGSYIYVAKSMVKECEIKYKNKTSLIREDIE